MLLTELTLEDLAQISGLSIRTLRYYIQEGLLPGPDTRGKFASYSQEHLDGLKLITRLKDMHMPLKEIRHLMDNMTDEDIRQMIEIQDKAKSPLLEESDTSIEKLVNESSSALEYIQSLTEMHETVQNMNISKPVEPGRAYKNQITSSKVRQETWQKLTLTDGVELQLRAPLDADTQRKVNELIDFAQNLFNKVKGRK